MKTKKSSPVVNLQSQVSELQEKLARSLADYANLEKRIESQRQMFVALTTITIITKMIEILDDLLLTQDHLHDQGLKITIDKFINILQTEGLSEVKADGVAFDPNTMECISITKGEENQVISVKKRGYTLNGQLIRPAQVIVGKKL